MANSFFATLLQQSSPDLNMRGSLKLVLGVD